MVPIYLLIHQKRVKLMNKSTILATVLAAFLCITASSTYLSSNAVAQSTGITETIDFRQASKKSTLANFRSNLYYSDKFEDVSVPVLKKSRTLKNCFQMSENDMLIIPSGKTLSLQGGANIDGTIFIEKGGKLVLDKFSVNLTGKIMCLGTVSVKNGTLYCGDDSLLYVAEGGKFTAADRGGNETELNGRILADPCANVVCLGTCNIPDPTFEAEPVAAVYCRMEFGGYSKKISEAKSKLSDLLSVKCNTGAGFGYEDFADVYTILFSGGSCVTYTANGSLEDGWSNIGGVDVQMMANFLSDYHSI